MALFRSHGSLNIWPKQKPKSKLQRCFLFVTGLGPLSHVAHELQWCVLGRFPEVAVFHRPESKRPTWLHEPCPESREPNMLWLN